MRKNVFIIFPAYPFEFPKVDPNFQEEKSMAELLQYNTTVIDYELLLEGRIKIGDPFAWRWHRHAIYRGWMLKPDMYEFLYEKLKSKNIELINDPNQYVACHHFPMAYYSILRVTPNAYWSMNVELGNDSEEDFASRALAWARARNIKRVILKDFVKSEKTNLSLFQIDTSVTEQEFVDILKKFRKERDLLFDTGFVIKEVRELRQYPDTDGKTYTNEWRVFVGFGKIISISPNSNQKVESIPDMTFIEEVVRHVRSTHATSNFFTVDFAEDANGEWFVLETGDGQVSGLSSSQNVLEFYNRFEEVDKIWLDECEEAQLI
jgi:hypothetical protein